MDSNKLANMSVDELWTLHTEVASVLSGKIAAEKSKLDARLREVSVFSVERERRPYPKVLPKYHNPKNPEQTWSGRGKLARGSARIRREARSVSYPAIRLKIPSHLRDKVSSVVGPGSHQWPGPDLLAFEASEIGAQIEPDPTQLNDVRGARLFCLRGAVVPAE